MSLDLDPRQRAMLEEMGVRVFWPEAPLEEEAAAIAAPVVAPPVRVAAPVPAPAAPASARPAAVAREQLAEPPAGAPLALLGSGDPQPDWLLVVDPPSEEEERQGQPVLGGPGQLLDNMLAALGLNRRQRVYIACVPRDAEAAAHAMRAQVRQLRPKVILAMGRVAVQTLLQTGEPPGRLRGRAHDFEGVPLVVTYHPAALLRNPGEKGKAWADLCLARSVIQSLE